MSPVGGRGREGSRRAWPECGREEAETCLVMAAGIFQEEGQAILLQWV